MHKAVRKYLHFVVNKWVYQFTCLHFGLATSPREFTKLLRSVATLLRKWGVKLHVYLDDWLIHASSSLHRRIRTTGRSSRMPCRFPGTMGRASCTHSHHSRWSLKSCRRSFSLQVFRWFWWFLCRKQLPGSQNFWTCPKKIPSHCTSTGDRDSSLLAVKSSRVETLRAILVAKGHSREAAEMMSRSFENHHHTCMNLTGQDSFHSLGRKDGMCSESKVIISVPTWCTCSETDYFHRLSFHIAHLWLLCYVIGFTIWQPIRTSGTSVVQHIRSEPCQPHGLTTVRWTATWHSVSCVLEVVGSLPEFLFMRHGLYRWWDVNFGSSGGCTTSRESRTSSATSIAYMTSMQTHCYDVRNEDYLIISWYLHAWNGVAVARNPPTCPAGKRSLGENLVTDRWMSCYTQVRLCTEAGKGLDFVCFEISSGIGWQTECMQSLLLRSIHEDTS